MREIKFDIPFISHIKTGQCVPNNSKKTCPQGWVKRVLSVTIDDLVTDGKIGFDALHEKLTVLAGVYHFRLEPLYDALATTNLFRQRHCVQQLGIPPFVATMVFNLLRESHACIGGGSSIQKTDDFVKFLKTMVNVKMPVATVNSKTQRYVIPNDISEFTSIMVGEELRLAEEVGAKADMRKTLRDLFHLKQREEREAMVNARTMKSGKKLSELDQIRLDIKADDDAEYDDRPSTKKKKKAVTKKKKKGTI